MNELMDSLLSYLSSRQQALLVTEFKTVTLDVLPGISKIFSCSMMVLGIWALFLNVDPVVEIFPLNYILIAYAKQILIFLL